MWAITPRLRIFDRSGSGGSLPMAVRPESVVPGPLYHKTRCTWAAGFTPGNGPRTQDRRLPGEVGERLVGVGHLDGRLALAHRLALAAVGGHQLVGEEQKRRLAGLVAQGG